MPLDIVAPSKHAIIDPTCFVIEQALNEIIFCDEQSLLRDLRFLYTTANIEGDASSKINLFLFNQMYQQVRVAKVGETNFSLVHEEKHSESVDPSQVFFVFSK